MSPSLDTRRFHRLFLKSSPHLLRSRRHRQIRLEQLEARLALAADLAELLQLPETNPLQLSDAAHDEQSALSKVTRTIVPGELLFTIEGNPSLASLEQNLANILLLSRVDVGGSIEVEQLLTSGEGDSTQTLLRLRLGDFQDVPAAAAVLKNTLPGVVWAEPNYSYAGNLKELTPNDEYYDFQPYHEQMETDLAWNTTLGIASVVIAVIDDGLQIDHPDILAGIYVNSADIFGNGIDDDGNGYIDDVGGWDFVTNDNNASPADATVDIHGTAVAGVIGARTNNSIGVAGVAGGARLMPLRVMGSDGDVTSLRLLNALRYAADNGADIVNTSLNLDPFVSDAAVTAAVQYVYDHNVLHIASAGNNQEDNPLRQAFTQTLFVGGIDDLGVKAGFSNYGTGIDLVAPSEYIATTVPVSDYAYIEPDSFTGTSMSSALVSGMAALIWSANPSLTRDQVARRITGSSTPVYLENPEYLNLLGSGAANSNRALNATLAPPQLRGLAEVPPGATPTIFPTAALHVQLGSVLSKAAVETVANWSLVSAGVDGALATADDVVVPLTLAQPYRIGANDVQFNFTTLTPGLYRFTAVAGAAALRDPFNVALDGDANGTAGGNFAKDFRVSSGTVAYLADFTTPAGVGETEGYTTSGPASAWKLSNGRGSDPGHSGTVSLYFGANETTVGGGSYPNSADGIATSPVIDLTGYSGPTLLEFNQFLQSEAGLDIASVRVIEGGGVREIATSADLLPANTTGFQRATLDISEFAGRSIRLQFRFVSNTTNTAEGWYVDDITIRSLGENSQANLSGQVWNDLNGNRARDAGENGLPGWTVYVDSNNNSALDAALVTNVPAPNVPRQIVDFNFMQSDIVVSGIAGNILDLDVTVNIEHTFTGDLDLILTSPTGFQILLASEEGADANFTNTRFDDEAATSIIGAAAPFTGSFRPEGTTLAALDGTNPNGTWSLTVQDFAEFDIGELTGWTLHFTTPELSRVTDASGNYAFANVPASTHVIREILQATWNQSLPIAGFYTVTPAAGTTLANLDFANSQGPVQPPNFLVATMTPTTTGVVLDFNHDLDTSTLNLYDTLDTPLGGADLVLTGATVGEIRGSVAIEPTLRRLTFIATVGRLPADNYTLTLRSAANGFRDSSLQMLDGDSNGTAGGNYTNTFIVTPPAANAVTIGLPNLARGPQQAVNVPAAAATGLPIAFSNGSGITTANFELRYNPALLNVTGATVAPGLVGATVNINTSTPGIAVIQFSSPSALAAGTTRFVDLQANVPNGAPYKAKHILNITNMSLNGGAIPALDDDAIHVVAYFGDATANGAYSGLDAALELRAAVALDRGFNEFRLLDPFIVGDITGNNAISSTDASYSLQLGAGLPVPLVPNLPAVGSIAPGGPDPQLSIPRNLVVAAGGSLQIPVMIDSIVDLTGNGLRAADLILYYDPKVLTVNAVSPGSVTANSNWIAATNIEPLAGRVIVSLAGALSLEGKFSGELLSLDATINADAPAGATAINLAAGARTPNRVTQLNEGNLTLIPAPTDAANDPIDGVLTVTRSADNAASARLVDGRLLIAGTAMNDRIFVAPLASGLVRVRAGNQFLGDFAATAGIVVDASTGRNLVYVAPTLTSVVATARSGLQNDDQIFGSENLWLIDENAIPLQARDVALLALIDQWSAQASGRGRELVRF